MKRCIGVVIFTARHERNGRCDPRRLLHLTLERTSVTVPEREYTEMVGQSGPWQ